VTTASATSIGSSETSRSGQVRVGFGIDDVLHALRALIVCCPSARSRSGCDNKLASLQGVSTGATGLEPATSGVTGLLHRNDGPRMGGRCRRRRRSEQAPGLGASTEQVFDHVHFGLDLAWDTFICLGTFLFGLAMLRRAGFGPVVGGAGMVIAVALYAVNFATFPEPPARARSTLGRFSASGTRQSPLSCCGDRLCSSTG